MNPLSNPWEIGEWSHGIKHDGLCALVGRPISNGRDRNVFEHAYDPALVVKVETGWGERQNEAEWRFWKVLSEGARAKGPAQAKFKEIARWFAPVVHLSPFGSFLIMRRTTKPPSAHKWPARVPSFLFDLKRQNFGMLDGRLVCHDYGITAGVLIHNELCGRGPSVATKRAQWWSEAS